MDEREPAILRAYNSLDLNSAGTLQRSQIKASLQRNGLPTTDRNINAMVRMLRVEGEVFQAALEYSSRSSSQIRASRQRIELQMRDR